MAVRRYRLLMVGLLALGACSSAASGPSDGAVAVTSAPPTSPTIAGGDGSGATPSTEPATTDPAATGATDPGGSATTDDTATDPGATDPGATDPPATATTAARGSSGPATTAPATTAPATTAPDTTIPATTVAVTTTTVPALDVYDPACVVKVAPGESLTLITDRIDDELVLPSTVEAENGLPNDVIHPDQLLDVCVGNGLDDITGDQRLEPNSAVQSIQNQANVIKQQERLNVLFAPYTIAPLKVDGISGPVTRQRLCAWRSAVGLPVSTEDMAAGSDEEAWLMALDFLPVPQNVVTGAARWALIDRTCQVMFVGTGPDQLVYVFPTSTGEAEHPTRDQDRSRVFRYDPASDNGGWHNSTTYPVAEDNPLNGNMYKPLYFDNGQAIHGANNVPTSPQSKGCARLRVEHQELLVNWLGLGGVTSPLGSTKKIDLSVSVVGEYVPR